MRMVFSCYLAVAAHPGFLISLLPRELSQYVDVIIVIDY